MLPHPVSQTSARVLEFNSLRDLLRGYATSPLGQGLIAHLAPSTDREWIENQQELTTEIREFRRVGGRFDFSGLLDVTKLVEKSKLPAPRLRPSIFETWYLWWIVPRSGAKLH
jgi:dsDNA-specific endonuclease/ATPase MutS2